MGIMLKVTEARKTAAALEAVLSEIEDGELEATSTQIAYVAGALEALRALLPER